MEFNFKKIVGKKVAVNCKNENEAIEFINWANSLRKDGHIVNHDFKIYGTQTCYKISDYLWVGFNSLNDFKKQGYEILSYQEALLNKMT